MGKDLNGKELGTGISQRPDGIYMARAQCCGKPICIYGRNYQKLKKELEEKKKQINLTSAIPRFAIRALITAMNFELSAFSCIDSSVLISSLFLVSKL